MRSTEKKTVVVRVRLTRPEYEYLEEKVKDKNSDLSKYIRKKVLSDSPFQMDLIKLELRNLTYQIRKIGVNINQIAAKVNSGYRGEDSLEILERRVTEIESYIETFAREVERYGSH